MARKAKYSEEWRSRAAALQANIEEAMDRHKGNASLFRCVWRRRFHEATTS